MAHNGAKAAAMDLDSELLDRSCFDLMMIELVPMA